MLHPVILAHDPRAADRGIERATYMTTKRRETKSHRLLLDLPTKQKIVENVQVQKTG